VPNERNIANIKRRENPAFDIGEQLETMITEIIKSTNIKFMNVACLVDEDDDQFINNEVYKQMRTWIANSEPFLNKHVKTWDEIVEFYEEFGSGKISEVEMKDALLSEMDEKIKKAEADFNFAKKCSHILRLLL